MIALVVLIKPNATFVVVQYIELALQAILSNIFSYIVFFDLLLRPRGPGSKQEYNQGQQNQIKTFFQMDHFNACSYQFFLIRSEFTCKTVIAFIGASCNVRLPFCRVFT